MDHAWKLGVVRCQQVLAEIGKGDVRLAREEKVDPGKDLGQRLAHGRGRVGAAEHDPRFGRSRLYAPRDRRGGKGLLKAGGDPDNARRERNDARAHVIDQGRNRGRNCIMVGLKSCRERGGGIERHRRIGTTIGMAQEQPLPQQRGDVAVGNFPIVRDANARGEHQVRMHHRHTHPARPACRGQDGDAQRRRLDLRKRRDNKAEVNRHRPHLEPVWPVGAIALHLANREHGALRVDQHEAGRYARAVTI